MNSDVSVKSNASKINRYFLLFLTLWTLFIAFAIFSNIKEENNKVFELIANEARTNFYKDKAFRLWGSLHGGVYVPPTKQTPPNPYLSYIPDRDIVTTDGKHLTLMNPAYMVRQLMEKYEGLSGVKGHITSLNPIRPENKADEWERKALLTFRQGTKEAREFADINGKPYLRLMKPLITQKSCLKCHAIQGYKEGEIRGGISVSVPATVFLNTARKHNIQHATILSMIWILGIVGSIFFTRHIKQRITEKELIENEKEKDRQYMQMIIDILPDSLMIINPDYTLALANQKVRNMSGYENPVQDGAKCYQVSVQSDVPCDSIGKKCPMKEVIKTQKPIFMEYIHTTKDGTDIPVEIIMSPIMDKDGNVVQIIESSRDVSDRKSSEHEQEKLKEQLTQAQKMESIGRLAGGVAHDFNNLLTGITGNVQLAQMDIDENDPLWEPLEDIGDAAERATELTQQLLAFSRKQIIKPKVMDLNEVLNKMHRMLKRIIGEDIDLKSITQNKIGNIKADPGQIEQIVINLAVNARDAMPKGGKLTIETGTHYFDSESPDTQDHMQYGKHVMLAISDNGHGIDKDTQKHIFDPFFTTKQTGEGTGLGLATVYGIVKQHNGSIEVYSESGKGTTFKIYFPEINDEVENIDKVQFFEDLPTGHETILVVEDVRMVRNIAIRTLNKLGYKVLEAEDGKQALDFITLNKPQIDLLLTDVIMPNMNGKELADEITNIYPNIKILFTSGYTDNVIAHHGVLEESMEFISKPYSPQDLSFKVRSVLDMTSS